MNRELELHKKIITSSVGLFTCKMYQAVYNRDYIVGEHHRRIFNALDRVIRGEAKKLIINIAPRYGKTLLVSQMFIAYGLAINSQSKFIHLSYSSSLAQDNSIAVKDIVNSDYYQALFETKVRYGADQKAKWETEQGGGMYAISTLGQVTGFGAGAFENDVNDSDFPQLHSIFSGAIIIDDPIKPEDALSDIIRERVNRRFETTIRSRVNSRNTPIVIVMQRLHEQDLCGYLQSIEPDEWEVLSMPCLTIDNDGNEKALWEVKDTVAELHKRQLNNPFVFQTQYQQNPKPIEGLMYSKFKTYEVMPLEHRDKRKLKCYIDTADTGADYLCAICYEEHEDGMYIIDVLYTDKAMEYTEVETAKMLVNNNIEEVRIESNNGGRGFARTVEKNVRLMNKYRMNFITFTQTKNKAVRIFSHSAEVQNLIHYPHDWEVRFAAFASSVKGYLKEGRNAHDDAVDALTGMVEYYGATVTDEEIEMML